MLIWIFCFCILLIKIIASYSLLIISLVVCSNEDYEKKKWKPRNNLVMATALQSNRGDYRRVSREVWTKFCEYYPGCGPEITTTFKYDAERKNDGLYDTSGWKIDNTKYFQVSEVVSMLTNCCICTCAYYNIYTCRNLMTTHRGNRKQSTRRRY